MNADELAAVVLDQAEREGVDLEELAELLMMSSMHRRIAAHYFMPNEKIPPSREAERA